MLNWIVWIRTVWLNWIAWYRTDYLFKNGFGIKKSTKVDIIITNPSDRAGYDTRSIFKRSLTVLNSEFSFSKTSRLTKAEEPSLPYYLPIAEGRIIGFIPFPRVLVLYEMQSVSSRIWTRVAVSISYDDNHYTTGTYKCWYAMKPKQPTKPHRIKIAWSVKNVFLSSKNRRIFIL